MATMATSSDVDRERRRKRHLEIHEGRVKYHDRRMHLATLAGSLSLTLVIIILLMVDGKVELVLLSGALLGYCLHSLKLHAAKVNFHQKLADEWRDGE